MIFKRKRKNLIIYLLLGIIILTGTWLRIEGIFTDSFAFTYDVGRDLLEVRKIVVDHNLAFIGPTTGLPGLFYGPWWYYILAVPFIFTGGNPQGIALFMALLGLISIVLGYYIGKIITGNSLGLILATIISFSPVMVGFSNQIWNPNIAPILVLLVFLILLVTYQSSLRNNAIFFLLFGTILGLLLDAEIVFGIYFILSIFIVLTIIFKRKMRSVRTVYIILGIFLTLFPRIIFEIKNKLIMTKTLLSSGGTASEATFSLPSITTISQRVTMFYNQFSETFFHGNKVFSLLLIIFVFFTIFKYYNHFSPIEKKLIKTFYIILIIFFVGISVFSHSTFDHYIVGLPILYILFIGISLNKALSVQHVRPIAFVVLLFIFYLSLQPFQIFSNLNKPLWEGDAAVYRNQRSVIDYIYNKAGRKGFNYIVYTPPVHDYTYKYLFSWYGKKTYEYTPSIKKENLFFLIIEPDFSHPERIKEWLRIRESDGKIKNQEVVKGGILVQTRIH